MVSIAAWLIFDCKQRSSISQSSFRHCLLPPLPPFHHQSQHSAEPRPEDQVEISFLRQCLENAMATELTPYERDILRLRLGLDSGEGKSVREIVDLSGGIVSMADVRSAERRAFKKLRSPSSVHTHNLLAYLDLASIQGGRG